MIDPLPAVSGDVSPEGSPDDSKASKCGPGSISNVETEAGAAQVSVAPPPDVPLQLVHGVESPAFDQTFRQAEGHGGVVGPFAGHQPVGAAAEHLGHGIERSRSHEFHWRAQGISHGQPQQGSPVPVQFLISIKELHSLPQWPSCPAPTRGAPTRRKPCWCRPAAPAPLPTPRWSGRPGLRAPGCARRLSPETG